MEDVYFKYKFGDDIIFELKEGEFVSVIGDNNDLIIHTLLHGNKKATIEVGDASFSPKTLAISYNELRTVWNSSSSGLILEIM